MIRDAASVTESWRLEQAENVRRGWCLLCSLPIERCDCAEYDRYDERPREGSDLEAGVE